MCVSAELWAGGEEPGTMLRVVTARRPRVAGLEARPQLGATTHGWNLSLAHALRVEQEPSIF